MAAAAVQQPDTPGVAELLFVLSETIKVVGHKKASRPPPIRGTLQDALVGILGIYMKDFSIAVCLDYFEPTPTLFVSSSDPSFFDHLKKSIALLREFASAAAESDPHAIRPAQAELINYILRHALSPHAAEYIQLRDRLQLDIDTGLVAEVVENPKDRKDSKGPKGPKPPTLRDEVEAWCTGLTCALTVIDKDTLTIDTVGSVDKFLEWAKARYFRVGRIEEKAYAHVNKYSEPPSAINLLRYVDYIVRAIVPPIMEFTDEELDPSSFAWLHNLTIKTLESSRNDSFKGGIDGARLKKWLSTLVYNPLIDARVSREVLETIISAETFHDKWTGYVNNAPIHPAVTPLIDVIGPRLEAASKKHDEDQPAHPSLVACAGASCFACLLCYEAMRQTYDLPRGALHLFPTAGAETTPHSPCRTVGRLAARVEEKFKILLSKEIKSRVTTAILERTPKPARLVEMERFRASQPSN